MAFVKRGEKDKVKSEPEKKEVIEFDNFREQAKYAINYLKSEYGIDIYDDTRKPAQHINSPNNPNYIGAVGESKSENVPINLTQNLLDFLKTQNK